MGQQQTPLIPKGLWVPYYREGALPFFRAVYDGFFLGALRNLGQLWAWFSGPAIFAAAFATVPLTILGVGLGYLPNLFPDWAKNLFPYLAWFSVLTGFFGPIFASTEEAEDFRSLKAHQSWRVRRLEYWTTGLLTLLWGWAWAQGGYEEFRGKMLYLDYVLSHPFYAWGAVAFGALRLLAVAAWTGAIVYRYEEIQVWRERGGREEIREEDVGMAKPGKVDPHKAAQNPNRTERQALLWELRQHLVLPPEAEEEVVDLILLLRHHEAYRRRFGADVPRGVLLVGPPGTGKTSIARFVAEKSGLSFVGATPGELRSKWLGESAQRIAKLFSKARNLAPVVVFVDELEAVAPRRGGHQEVDHAVGQLLQELDGIRSDTARGPVIFVGASNYPENVDPAILSRIGTLIHIPLPGLRERKRILEILLGEHAAGVDLERVAMGTEGFSGRDLKTLVTRAFRATFTSGEPQVTTEILLKEAFNLRMGGTGKGGYRG